ncbi:hypothetical protein R6Q59_016142, partial [Mikania micrantha]
MLLFQWVNHGGDITNWRFADDDFVINPSTTHKLKLMWKFFTERDMSATPAVAESVLIGCNYAGTKAELRGCVNDVKRMYRCLVDRYGFSEYDINVLIDTDDSYTQPTGRNIRKSLDDLVGSAEPGDFLFVHYSRHGTRLPTETDDDDDDTGYDECIVPCDFNLIY